MNVNVKKQRRFDCSTVIVRLKDKNFLTCADITNCKNANEIETKNSKIFRPLSTHLTKPNFYDSKQQCRDTTTRLHGFVLHIGFGRLLEERLCQLHKKDIFIKNI